METLAELQQRMTDLTALIATLTTNRVALDARLLGVQKLFTVAGDAPTPAQLAMIETSLGKLEVSAQAIADLENG